MGAWVREYNKCHVISDGMGSQGCGGKYEVFVAHDVYISMLCVQSCSDDQGGVESPLDCTRVNLRVGWWH